MSERIWFYMEADAQQGPVSREELISLLRQRLRRDTLVWRDGLPDWLGAEDVAELGLKAASPPPPPPRMPPAPRPARTPAPRMELGAARDEPPSSNPFVLWRRCFAWTGRFDRGEFAIAYLGQLFAMFALFMGVGVLGALLSGPGRGRQDASAMLIGAATLLILPFGLIVALGAVVRRLHDIGQNGWLALLMLLPCVNFVLVIYLLVAQGRSAQAGGATAPAGAGIPPLAIVAIVVVAFIPIVGIVAAIAIPSLLRARIAANEASVIGDIRTILSAEAAYQASNSGPYGTITCLSTPSGCLPGYNGPPFLDASLAQPQATVRGYVRRWSEVPASRGARGSIELFCYSATPAQPNQTGVRSFGGDSSGLIGVASGVASCCGERGLDLTACPPIR